MKEQPGGIVDGSDHWDHQCAMDAGPPPPTHLVEGPPHLRPRVRGGGVQAPQPPPPLAMGLEWPATVGKHAYLEFLCTQIHTSMVTLHPESYGCRSPTHRYPPHIHIHIHIPSHIHIAGAGSTRPF